jgi:Zn-dependent hydrolases, including glyoxylases
MILFTHFHFDHLWGISDHDNASLLFPSAEFVASETEVAFWSAPDLVDKLPPEQQPRVTQANLKLATPRLRLIKAGAEVVPGVTTFGTPGHTPGHIVGISVPAAKNCSSPATSWSTRRSASCIRNGRSGST